MGRIRHHGRPRSGITLIELLVVMAIAAIIGGMTVASFAAIGRRSSREGAAQNVVDLLRRAQISAVDSGRGALVRIDPVQRALYGLSSTVEGSWHFEEITPTTPGVTPGSKRYDGICEGGMNSTSVVDGAVGLCLEFDGDNDYVDCGSPPVFNQTDGVRLELWVKPAVAGTSIHKGDVLGVMGKASATGGYAIGLQCTDEEQPGTYSVRAGFVLAGPAPVQLAGVGDYQIFGNEWSQIAIEFDGYEARLFVNGVLADLDSYRDNEASPTAPLLPNPVKDPNDATDVAFAPGSPLLAARSATLDIGRSWDWHDNEIKYFEGAIDEPKILSVAGGQRVLMPDKVPIVASDEVIHFDGQGRLDIAYHSDDVFIAVGDPYQAAVLDGGLAWDSTGPIRLRPSNPMPPNGDVVLIGGELIHYDSAAGRQLNLSDLADRAQYRTLAADHADGDSVLFARVVRVTPAGVVQRVETGP
jgi:prepilin-type N-terminal cleavage/methylation domain-containing protein